MAKLMNILFVVSCLCATGILVSSLYHYFKGPSFQCHYDDTHPLILKDDQNVRIVTIGGFLQRNAEVSNSELMDELRPDDNQVLKFQIEPEAATLIPSNSMPINDINAEDDETISIEIIITTEMNSAVEIADPAYEDIDQEVVNGDFEAGNEENVTEIPINEHDFEEIETVHNSSAGMQASDNILSSPSSHLPVTSSKSKFGNPINFKKSMNEISRFEDSYMKSAAMKEWEELISLQNKTSKQKIPATAISSEKSDKNSFLGTILQWKSEVSALLGLSVVTVQLFVNISCRILYRHSELGFRFHWIMHHSIMSIWIFFIMIHTRPVDCWYYKYLESPSWIVFHSFLATDLLFIMILTLVAYFVQASK